MRPGVLIVGGGLAGARCAETLRAGGYGQPVVLVGAERFAPYDRPALSKDVLAGRKQPDETLLRPSCWWDELEVDLRLGVAVESIDLERRLASAGGRELPWSELVLATGVTARSLPELPPSARALRTLDDAVALRERLVPGRRLTILGAGLIGAEVASTALGLGCSVTLVDAAPVPLEAAVGRTVGNLLAQRWRDHGVDLRLDARVTRIQSTALTLDDGTILDHDELLVAVGTAPSRTLVGGRAPVPTDDCGRTDYPHVFACGDGATFGTSPTGHWTAAAAQGATVARTILGDPAPLREPPYFWSDQFGLRLQMVGSHVDAATCELEGDDDSFQVRYHDREERVVATLLANRPADVGPARRQLVALS